MTTLTSKTRTMKPGTAKLLKVLACMEKKKLMRRTKTKKRKRKMKRETRASTTRMMTRLNLTQKER